MDELIDLPDGKYILPSDLARRCKQLHQRIRGMGGWVIRCSIVEGRLWQFKTADTLSYYSTREGANKAEGHVFITNEVELMATVNALPYSWRL